MNLDTVFLAADGTAPMLLVSSFSGNYLYAPCLRWLLEANEFGYQYQLDAGSWDQVEEGAETMQLVLWLDDGFPVDDQYKAAYESLNQWKENRQFLLGLTIVCSVAGVLLTAYLCAAAGHKRDREGIALNWFHRVPGDLLLVLICFGVALAVGMVGEVTRFYTYSDLPMAAQLVLVGLLVAAAAAMCLGGLLTVVVRCKAHTLWRNTLVWRFCSWLWNLCREAVLALPLVWKAVIAGLAYMMFTILFFNYYGGLWLLGSGLCIAFLGVWAFQWKKVRRGAQEIIAAIPSTTSTPAGCSRT